VRQRLPAATETDDLDIVLAAAVGNGFLWTEFEARDVAAASEDADSLFRHDDPLYCTLMGLAGPSPWGSQNPARGAPRGGVHAVSYFNQSRLAAVANDPWRLA